MNLQIDITPGYCNGWPKFKISFNKTIIFDNSVTNTTTLNFDLECNDKNTLVFEHYGKKFGEDGIWDTNENEDKFVCIDDIRFDEVSIDSHLKNKLVFVTNFSGTQEYNKDIAEFHSYGALNFNGTITLNFECPVYDWLILAKYKVPVEKKAFFSNNTTKWHYEEDLKIIQEIKELMDDQNSSNNCS